MTDSRVRIDPSRQCPATNKGVQCVQPWGHPDMHTNPWTRWADSASDPAPQEPAQKRGLEILGRWGAGAWRWGRWAVVAGLAYDVGRRHGWARGFTEGAGRVAERLLTNPVGRQW